MRLYEGMNEYGQEYRAVISSTGYKAIALWVEIRDWENGKWYIEFQKIYTTIKGAERALLKRYPYMKRVK